MLFRRTTSATSSFVASYGLPVARRGQPLEASRWPKKK